MNYYSMFLPNYTIGQDSYEMVDKICRAYGKRALLIGGKKALTAGEGLLRQALENSTIEICGVEIYGTDCTYQAMDRLIKIAQDLKADMIFGMGGGKAIDTAKGTAGKLNLPVFTFPTISATCAGTSGLSVVYNEDGSFNEFYFRDTPAQHCFINTQIIANAPIKYLRAGIGDTLGKYFEAHFASRGDKLSHSSALGVEISNMCYKPILEYGEEAMRLAQCHNTGFELEQVILAIIVTTGLVSLFVLDQYNGAVAHSVCYGLTVLPEFEKNNLHGDVVAYGILVQLAVDNNMDELKLMKKLLKSLTIPTTLKEMGVELKRDELEPVLKEIVAGPDMEHIPYRIDEDMIFNAMVLVEAYK